MLQDNNFVCGEKEINLVKDLTNSLVAGGSIDAFRNNLKEKVCQVYL